MDFRHDIFKLQWVYQNITPTVHWERSACYSVLGSVLVTANIVKYVISVDREAVLFQVSTWTGEAWTTWALGALVYPQRVRNQTISPLYLWFHNRWSNQLQITRHYSMYVPEKKSSISIRKKSSISRPTQFKPELFKCQLYCYPNF